MGYSGLNFPPNIDVNNGDKVFKMNTGKGAVPEQMTVFKSGGKLKKYVQRTMTLTDIIGVPMSYTEMTSYDPMNMGQPTQYRVAYDGSSFAISAKMNCTENGPCMWGALGENDPAALDLSKNNYMPELNFWSEALGGQVRVKLNCPTGPQGGGSQGGCQDSYGNPITFDEACRYKTTSTCTDPMGIRSLWIPCAVMLPSSV